MLQLRDRANRDRRPTRRYGGRSAQLWLGGERRWANRAETRLAAALRERQRTRFQIEVINLSPFGCAARTTRPLQPGDQAWIMLPGIESWYARTAWFRGDVCGLDFAAPLHKAVAEMIVARSRDEAA